MSGLLVPGGPPCKCTTRKRKVGRIKVTGDSLLAKSGSKSVSYVVFILSFEFLVTLQWIRYSLYRDN